jgi:hypothetical protein
MPFTSSREHLLPALFAVLVLSNCACPESPPVGPDSGGTSDAGQQDSGRDSGTMENPDASILPDAAFPSDAGMPADAGSQSDSGAGADSGGAVDSGTTIDSGATTDSGTGTDSGAGIDSGSLSDAGSGVCNPPCPSGWACNAGTCKPQLVTCGSATCSVGQVCQVGTCTCTVPNVVQSGNTITYVDDSCFNYGMNCDAATGLCQLPDDLQYCSPLSGCATGLDCIDTTSTQNSSGATVPVYRCTKACTSSADCDAPNSSCYTTVPPGFDPPVQNHCFWNLCQTLFAPCAGAVNDGGTCLPMTPTLWEVRTTTGQVNFPYVYLIDECLQSGSANPNGNCNPSAMLNSDAGLSQLCSPSDVCVPITASDGYCEPACNTCGASSGGNPLIGCASGSACSALVWDDEFQGLSCQSTSAVAGYCAPSCQPLGSTTPCAPNADGRLFTCQVPLTIDAVTQGSGQCTPTIPDAGVTGATCNQDDTAAWTCTDRNYCTDLFMSGNVPGTCEPYCDYTACAAVDGGCQSGCPAGTLCFDVLNNAVACGALSSCPPAEACISSGTCQPVHIGFCF